jgi:hypothetical protein
MLENLLTRVPATVAVLVESVARAPSSTALEIRTHTVDAWVRCASRVGFFRWQNDWIRGYLLSNMMIAPLSTLLLALTMLLFSHSALAGNMSFGLSMTGSQLTVVNQGNSSAFYPAVFRMRSDGSWVQLETVNVVAELAPGAHLELIWPDAQPAEEMSELERMQPVMVRFFDQSGVGFGQITFFNAPPASRTVLKAAYVNGVLLIEPPTDPASSVRASWVLWPQEDGINPIRLPVRFVHRAPGALRIDWRSRGRTPLRLNTGAGQPTVILLHETEHGYGQQYVPDGGLQGREQRVAWLDATPQLYAAALAALVFAAAAMVLQFLRRARGSTMSSGAHP